MKYNIPLVLFAGGKSSRMGKDKALLSFGTYNTLSEYQYLRMQTLFKDVYLAAKNDKFDFDATVIQDRYPASSPLVGIVSAFETLTVDEIFILAVDAPFVHSKIIDTLMEHKEDCDVIIAESLSGQQPLCGIYKRSVLPFAQKHLKHDNHRIGNLLKEVKTKTLFFDEDDAFANLNHPHEYAEALKRS